MYRDDDATELAGVLLENACKRGGHDWQNIVSKIRASHCQLWITDGAALVTQATTDDVLECLLAGGSGAINWTDEAEQVLSQFAAENGLHTLRIWGRKGWIKYFPHWENMGTEDGLVILERAT